MKRKNAFIYAMAGVLICNLITGGTVANSAPERSETVVLNIKKSGQESTIAGIGYDAFEFAHILVMHLTAPSHYWVYWSDVSSGVGFTLVSPSSNIPAKTHTYKIAGIYEDIGILPNQDHSAVFWGKLIPIDPGEPTGPGVLPDFEVRLSFVDVDVDSDSNSSAAYREPSGSSDEDNAEYPGYGSPDVVPGIVIGVNDDHDEYLPVDPAYWDRDYAYHASNALRTEKDTPRSENDNVCVTPARLRGKAHARKSGKFKITSIPGNVRLFHYSTKQPVSAGTTFDVSSGSTFNQLFYIEGISEASNGLLTGEFNANTNNKGKAEDRLRITTVKVDLDVDSNNNGTEDYNDSEDLLEAKPTEMGMLVSVDETPDESPPDPPIANLPKGKIHQLSNVWTNVASAGLNPVIKLKKIDGEGDVRVYKADGTLILDTSATPAESSNLYTAMAAGDMSLRFMGIKNPGEVILALESTINSGVKVHVDKVKITTGIDLDVDSDNNNFFDPPDRDPSEEAIEDDNSKAGKYVMVNDDDNDNDGIPDFADGYDRDGTASNDDDTTTGEAFTPLILELPKSVDVSTAKVRFTYEASDPAGVTCTGTSPDFEYTPPASGKLRIWMKDGDETRNKTSIAAGTPGDYVPTDAFAVSKLGFTAETRTVTLYIEGIVPSDSLGSSRILVEVDPDGDGPKGFLLSDAVRLTVAMVDLDVDSDNNNALNAPDRNLVEDHYENVEDDPTRPGKIVVVNDNDIDDDGVPDFADGYNFDGTNGNDDDTLTGGAFTPLVLEIPAPVDLAKAKIMFSYYSSDPASVTRTGTAPNFIYTPASGEFRIWTKNGNQQRNSASVAAATPGDYVPTDENIPAANLGLAGATRQVTLYIEGIDSSEDIAETWIEVIISPEGGEDVEDYALADGLRLTVIRLDLDVDTDRDDNITQLDERDEKTWTKGTNSRGAIILPNCDKDSAVGTKGPDNWPGGDWDLDGTDDPANTKVDTNDTDDIGPLRVPKLGPDNIPENVSITLTVTKPATENAFFTGVDAKDRIRIFLPTDISGDNLVVKEGDDEIIGPSTSDSIEFVASPSAGQKDINVFQGIGTIEFGIEGIEIGAMVDVTMTTKVGTTAIATDTVRVRVAPYTLLDHTCPVDGTGHTVFVENEGANNNDLRTKLDTKYGARLLQTTIGDTWHQDGYEVGYVKAPSG